MRSFLHAVAGLAMATLLLIAHRAAYKGYFSDDDLNNLVMTRSIQPEVFARVFATPVFMQGNFRPSGHIVYHLLANTAGLHFARYITVLHLLHGLNILLIWLLLRKMGAPPLGAWAGTALFAFHMAAFDALWKPMYIFDVLCGTFTLLTLLFYLRGWWLAALLPFWLGYKSKELIVVLPVLLLAWELLAGQRQWKRVLPFLAIAASFSLQGVLYSAGTNDDYTLRFTLAALGATLPFYGSAMLPIPYLGLALPLLAFVKEAKVRWGLLFLFLMPAPLWFLPARLFSVYLYVPLIGLAVAVAFLAARWHAGWVALFLVIWTSGNYGMLRKKRAETLSAAADNRAYVTAVGEFLLAKGPFDAVIYDGGPSRMNVWGREAAIRWFDARPELLVCAASRKEEGACLERPRLAVVSWDQRTQSILHSMRTGNSAGMSYVNVSRQSPLWVLGEGWHELENGFRWTGAEASARLKRPKEAHEFAVVVNVSPAQLKEQGEIGLEVLVDGRSLGVRNYTKAAWSEQRWFLEPGPPGDVAVTLRAVKAFRPSNGDPRLLGVAVGAFGFVE